MKVKYEREAKQIEKSKEMIMAYRHYEKILSEQKLYDYNDMIIEVVRALKKDPSLLLSLQEQYQYLLADEHQDANNGQNKILELLSSYHENPNIFIVGDEKQAIFRFQGASLNNFLEFQKLYPSAKIIYLEDNYRSTQTILDAAHSLAEKNKPHVDSAKPLKKLKALSGLKENPINILGFDSDASERFFLVKDIEKLIEETKLEEGDESFPDVAVIYRDNADAFSFASTFSRSGIPVVIQSDENVLHDAGVKKIVSVLKAIENLDNDEYLSNALLVDFFEVEPSDIAFIGQESLKTGKSFFKILNSEENLKKIGLKNEKAIVSYIKFLSKCKKYASFHSLAELFEKIVKESKILNSIMSSENPIPALEKLNAFFKEIKSVSERHKNHKLADFLLYIDTLYEHNVPIKAKNQTKNFQAVKLLTAHKSKGMEFDYVYIVRCFDGHWGNRRRLNSLKIPEIKTNLIGLDEINDDDERRLFYVALTRAKKTVTISYSSRSDTGEEKLPSRFIQEIREELIQKKDTNYFDETVRLNPFFDFVFEPKKSAKKKDLFFVKELFSARGLSVTGLNNYLECPWKYFFVNLLRLPQAKAMHQLYGTAIHESLAGFFQKLNSSGVASKEFLLTLFQDALNKQPILEADYEASLERGRSALSGYYDEYEGKWRTRVFTELDIRGVDFSEGTRLTGKLDKVEILSDSLEVNVVDYKTGIPKSRNEIEGKTKNSKGNIKRQIIFYKILLDKYAGGKYKMISAEVDFIEPNERGNYKKELFMVSGEDTEKVNKEIKEVSGEILSLSFQNKRCGDAKCNYCSLKEIMR